MTNVDNIIGKKFQLLAINDTVIHEFKINHVKHGQTPAQTFDDGSNYLGSQHTYVSENGYGWYRIYGGNQDRII